MIEYLTKNQVKAVNRVENAQSIANILELFFELGYRSKKDVFTQLTIHFPKYDTTLFKKQFNLFWNFRSFDLKILRDLETVIDKINAQ